MALSLVLGGWAGAIAWSDWAERRIPNAALMLLLVPAGLALALNGQGLLGAGPASSLAGFALALAVLLPGYAMGQLGAGDVKFAACLGLLLGAGRTAEMLLAFALLLGAASALAWWHRGNRRQRLPAAPMMAAAFAAELIAGPWLDLLWQ